MPLLRQSYLTCLKVALENGVQSIALSCTSTGAYRYPSRQAAHIALRTVREWLEIDDNATKVMTPSFFSIV